MDTFGEADQLGDEDLPAADSPWTPEAQALTGAGLVLASMLTIGLFQALSFYVDGGGLTPRLNGILFTLPTALMAGAGALIGWSARHRALTPTLRGLAVSAAVVGGVVALSSAAGLVAVLAFDDRY